MFESNNAILDKDAISHLMETSFSTTTHFLVQLG